MSGSDLLQTIDGRGVARLTLNRPEVRNALSAGLISALAEAASRLGDDVRVRVVVIEGAGSHFCAGGDLNWMKAQIEADRETRMAEARRIALMLRAVNELPKPVIARIHGGAFGGGVGLACVADVAVAAETSKFGLTETRLGLIPATIGPYVVARLGEGMARRVLMSSRVFGAEEAAGLGVVARAVPEDALDAAVEAEVAPYLSVAPEAVASAKAMARSLGPVIDDQVIEASIRRLADTWDTEAARHGIAAFLEKRPPRWA